MGGNIYTGGDITIPEGTTLEISFRSIAPVGLDVTQPELHGAGEGKVSDIRDADSTFIVANAKQVLEFKVVNAGGISHGKRDKGSSMQDKT
jgi:hypothetical protein